MRSLVFTLEHRNTIREKVIGDDITVKKLVTSFVETQEYYQRESYRYWKTVKKLVNSSVEKQEYYQRESYRWSNNRKKACHVICWKTGILSERKL